MYSDVWHVQWRHWDGSNVLTLYDLIFNQMMLNKIWYLEREHDISDRIGHCFCMFCTQDGSEGLTYQVKSFEPSGVLQCMSCWKHFLHKCFICDNHGILLYCLKPSCLSDIIALSHLTFYFISWILVCFLHVLEFSGCYDMHIFRITLPLYSTKWQEWRAPL